MRILVFQHERVEHPGIFRRFMAEDGHEFVPVELDEGEANPPLDGFDALWVLGGPQDVWEEEANPWLVAEKRAIREAVEERGLPYLGICLGHQLLAVALGGEVGPAAVSEVGITDVRLTEDGASGVFLDGVEDVFATFQWHLSEVTRLPAGAQVLATSPACAVQAMKWGTRAYSVQFHAEVEEDTVRNWTAVPECAEALERMVKRGSLEAAVTRLDAETAERIGDLNSLAERIYINWLQTAAQA